MLAVALERSVKEQPPTGPQITARTCEQALGNAPWRDVDHIGAEHRQQFAGAAAVAHLGTPCRIGKVDPERRMDIRQPCMRPPCRDAFEMLLVEVARPPRDFGNMPREIDHMLAGAAAGLKHVAGFPLKKWLQHRADRLMVAVERRRVETT